MDKILLVEDSKTFATVLKKGISTLHIPTKWATNYADSARLIDEEKPGFSLALLDVVLPDALNGEVVDLALSCKIPSIVITGKLDKNLRDKISSKKVIDYVLKEGAYTVEYIVSLISRISKNRHIKVLVVDDSRSSRAHITELLEVHQYNVFEAEGGAGALKVLEENPDIKMVITDYHMPEMNGLSLTLKIRAHYTKEELAVIGVSSHTDEMASVQFIKNGGNDFIRRPFINEEFYCRITQNIEFIEYMHTMRESLNRDYLTGIFNRRYLLDSGRTLHALSLSAGMPVTIAMLDIDHFKTINDTYGHDAGDEVLKEVALLLKGRFRESDIVSRFGGEEFCIVTTSMAEENAFNAFEDIRREIQGKDFRYGNTPINITVSTGICGRQTGSFEEMIKLADEALYKAKRNGRNRAMMVK